MRLGASKSALGSAAEVSSTTDTVDHRFGPKMRGMVFHNLNQKMNDSSRFVGHFNHQIWTKPGSFGADSFPSQTNPSHQH
jgi:hypothetical protein